MSIIQLQAIDGDPIEVDASLFSCSEVINDMLSNTGDDDNLVPLGNVDHATLKKIIEWATYHKDDPLPTKEDDENKDNRTDDICPWDAEFLNVDQEMLFSLMLAANYMNIQGLFTVTCKTVANMIKGKTSEEIRRTFNVKNDFSKEEEELVLKENEWCEERQV